jgi:hypothetical protein
MPHMVMIAPGEKKLFQTAATPKLRAAATRAAFAATPRFVQVKVAILRDITPFAQLIATQDGRTRHQLSDALFEQWFESTDTIFLNTLPVHFVPSRSGGAAEESGRSMGSF